MPTDRAIDVAGALAALRWNVKTWGVPKPIAPGVEVLLRESKESAAHLAIVLRINGREITKQLAKEHAETKGKSPWFRDNTWRLSPSGIDFFTPGLVVVLNTLDAKT